MTAPATHASPAIPGLPEPPATGHRAPAHYRQHHPAVAAYDSHDEQAFIDAIAPGALAAQRRYGVPASVTIAQAIDESGWGRSMLATKDHNLFGIKGTGPAGSEPLATSEYQNGQMVTMTSPFRIYYNVAESINDHGMLLATSPYYRAAMASRHNPNAFATALTGIYATDPQYGAKLIGLMQRYNLYRYDAAPPRSVSHNAPNPGGTPPARGTATPRTAPAPGGARRPVAGRHPQPVAPTPSAPAPNPAPRTRAPRPRPTIAVPGKANRSPGRPRQQPPPASAAIPGLPTTGPVQPAHARQRPWRRPMPRRAPPGSPTSTPPGSRTRTRW